MLKRHFAWKLSLAWAILLWLYFYDCSLKQLTSHRSYEKYMAYTVYTVFWVHACVYILLYLSKSYIYKKKNSASNNKFFSLPWKALYTDERTLWSSIFLWRSLNYFIIFNFIHRIGRCNEYTVKQKNT